MPENLLFPQKLDMTLAEVLAQQLRAGPLFVGNCDSSIGLERPLQAINV